MLKDLVSINIGSGVTRIGTESFYGSGVQELVFPTTIDEIGPGAFANCRSLSRIDFSNVTGSDIKIDQYAFFNTVALNEVNMTKKGTADVTVGISSIREGAFATDSGVIGNLTDFVFPSSVKSPAADARADGLGDYVLAGRTNLQRVIMPADFGRDKKAMLPDNVFYNCYNSMYGVRSWMPEDRRQNPVRLHGRRRLLCLVRRCHIDMTGTENLSMRLVT